jgi:hypothetical protein
MTQVQRMTGRLTDWFVLGAQFSTTNYADKRIGSLSVSTTDDVDKRIGLK